MSAPLPSGPAEKRAILYGEKSSEDELNAYADAYTESERFGEALEFLERTRDPARLDRIRRVGLERGDTFLLLRVENLRREPLAAEDWREAAGRALAAGKYHDAYRALLRAGDEEKAEAVRAEHMPDYEPFKPEGK